MKVLWSCSLVEFMQSFLQRSGIVITQQCVSAYLQRCSSVEYWLSFTCYYTLELLPSIPKQHSLTMYCIEVQQQSQYYHSQTSRCMELNSLTYCCNIMKYAYVH